MKMKSRFLLLFLLMAVMIAGTAGAESSEADLYYNDTTQSILISVLYENDDVDISFIDPEGNTVSLDSDSVVYSSGETSMFVIIRNAAEGQWKIRYDKGSNEYIEYYVQAYEDPMWITSLELGDITADSLNVKFTAAQEAERQIKYRIYLGTDAEMTTRREIGSGYAKTNTETDVSVSLKDVNTYDSYYLSVYVSYTEDGVEYFDEAVTGPFAYTNSETVDGVEDYYVEIDKNLNTILVSLKGYLPYSATGAYITVTADGSEIISEYVSGDLLRVQAELPENAVTIECIVTVRNRSGLVSSETIKKFELFGADVFTLDLPESGIQNHYKYEFSYANAAEQSVYFTVNNGETEELVLDGDGRQYTTFSEVQNSIHIEYSNEEGVLFVYNESVAVDAVPPALALYEDLDGITVSDESVIIAGKAEPGCLLTINDTEVELSERGVFDYEYTLSDGVNTITVNAVDDAGNITSYAIKVNKSTAAQAVGNITDNETVNKILGYAPLAIALFASLFGITVLVIAASGKKKKLKAYLTVKREAVALLIFSIIGGGCSFAVYLLRRDYEKSPDYIELSADFPKKAYEYLQNTRLILIAGLVFAALAVFSVIVMLITSLIKKSAVKKAERNAVSEAEQSTGQKAEKDAVKIAEQSAGRKAEKDAEREAEQSAVQAADRQDEEEAEANADTADAAETEIKAAEETAEPETEEAVEMPEPEEAKKAAEPEEKVQKEKPQHEKENKPQKDYKFCVYCGKKMKMADKFCGSCGKKQ